MLRLKHVKMVAVQLRLTYIASVNHELKLLWQTLSITQGNCMHKKRCLSLKKVSRKRKMIFNIKGKNSS